MMGEMQSGPPRGLFFEQAGRVLLAHGGRSAMTPFQLLDSWRGVLEASREGSELGWDEFNHDRQVRNFIQLLLDDEDLQRAPQFELWARQVAEVDHAYREMLVPLPGVRPGVAWWLAGVPSAAGRELAHDLSEMFGLQVKVIS